ncbi:MAG: hypothetical protein ACLUTH_03165 [Blautia massiliensis (ex Durand et al. 2017)]
MKFGVGIVKNIVDGGRDYEVTVDFDKVGVKKNVRRFCQAEKDLIGSNMKARMFL